MLVEQACELGSFLFDRTHEYGFRCRFRDSGEESLLGKGCSQFGPRGQLLISEHLQIDVQSSTRATELEVVAYDLSCGTVVGTGLVDPKEVLIMYAYDDSSMRGHEFSVEILDKDGEAIIDLQLSFSKFIPFRA